ncbi:MAG TPA: AtpZ/AtpI family protein [Patescibacteria group bacterium]|nr:AtpZ/AtpI family protein [Patescibacteria group bacterium]
MAEQNQPKNERSYYLFALRIVGDFGATIAVPVVALSLLGKYLDQRWQTGPWLLIIGFVLSLLISVLIIYRKAKRYGQEYQKLS